MNSTDLVAGVDRRALLSTLWIFTLFNMLFRDIHEFVRPGFLQEIITGVVQPSETLLLAAGIVLELLILMVVLARVLPYRPNRWANIAVGTLAIAALLFNGVNDLDDIFFSAVQIIALVAIIGLAWRWPAPDPAPDPILGEGSSSAAA